MQNKQPDPPRSKRPDDILLTQDDNVRPDNQQVYDDNITQYEVGEPEALQEQKEMDRFDDANLSENPRPADTPSA